eukprot:scaffold429_cov321-Prasinococcus_capsulatus_cf.AAC.6
MAVALADAAAADAAADAAAAFAVAAAAHAAAAAAAGSGRVDRRGGEGESAKTRAFSRRASFGGKPLSFPSSPRRTLSRSPSAPRPRPAPAPTAL